MGIVVRLTKKSTKKLIEEAKMLGVSLADLIEQYVFAEEREKEEEGSEEEEEEGEEEEEKGSEEEEEEGEEE